MGLGIALTKIIDITSLTHLIPTFSILSAISIGTALRSSRLVDENSLNNQRAHLLFQEYLSSGKLLSMQETNAGEVLSLPNFLNYQHCKFIKFGEKSISTVVA